MLKYSKITVCSVTSLTVLAKYIIYCNRDKLKVISYIWPLSQHIIQEVSCATYRCGHQIYSHQCTGILSKSPNDDKKCRKEKNCWKKTRHCYYQTTEPNACLWVYNCRRKKWNEDKKPYYDAKKQPIQNLWNEKKTRQIIVQCLPLQLLLVLWQ